MKQTDGSLDLVRIGQTAGLADCPGVSSRLLDCKGEGTSTEDSATDMWNHQLMATS